MSDLAKNCRVFGLACGTCFWLLAGAYWRAWHHDWAFVLICVGAALISAAQARGVYRRIVTWR